MKVRPNPDYPVRVIRAADDEPTEAAPCYEEIFMVVLNHEVTIDFVPDVSHLAPPWDDRLLPANFDDITTSEQARIATVLLTRYAVTPNERLAGQAEQFDGWVRYVTPAEYDRFALELARLNELAASKFDGPSVSRLQDYEVIRFIAEQIVLAPWLDPYHYNLLRKQTE